MYKIMKSAKLLKPVWNALKTTVRYNPYPVQFLHFLRNLPITHTTKLDNGLTVATEERECFNVCVGIYIDAGSRYENTFENGIAHFFEHIAYKSTKSRSKTALDTQMQCTGAKFGCFTTREMVAYFAQCLCQDVPLVVDILADCVFNNNLDSNEIEYQKSIVYKEMTEHDQSWRNDLVIDYLIGTAFQGTPLAQTIIGPSCNLYNFNNSTISRYLLRRFDPSKSVLCAVGGIKHDQLVYLANLYMSKLEPKKCIDEGIYRFTGSEVKYRDDNLPVANVSMAVEGPSFCDDDNLVMQVAARYLGGWDRSQYGSKHACLLAQAGATGLVDSYKAFNISFKDTGLWGMQMMGRSLNLEDIVYLVQSEWMGLCTTITEGEVARAKRELKTNILTRYENSLNTCHDIGRWILYNDFRPPLHERICSIDNIHAEQVKEVCNRYIYDKCLAVSAVGAVEGLPEYTRIRSGMYWLRL